MENAMILSKNFYRSARLAALGCARECRRWLRIHRERGQWRDAENVRQAMFGYMGEARRLSRSQKRIDAIWAELAA
jgi:hypothetical protein